jgi:hypothetical protein
MRREKVVLGVFCVFLVVVVEDGFYDVVGPRKFGDFGSRGGSRLRGNEAARLTIEDLKDPISEQQLLWYMPGSGV